MYLSSLPALITAALYATSTHATCSHNTHLYDIRQVEEAPFGYTGLRGPLNWYSLSPNNTACAKGRHQTPINLDSNVRKEASTNYTIRYPSIYRAVIQNLGTTVEVDGTPIKGTVEVKTGSATKVYELRQFHFHTPSEHRIEEEYFPMEIHFVHVAPSDGQLLVIAFLLNVGSMDESDHKLIYPAIRAIEAVPKKDDEAEVGPLSFDTIMKSFKENPVYRYQGSLTTPPCREGVEWIVSTKPFVVDYKTFNNAKRVLRFNSRYTQNRLGEENLLEHAAKELNKS